MTGLDLLMEGDLKHSSHGSDRGEDKVRVWGLSHSGTPFLQATLSPVSARQQYGGSQGLPRDMQEGKESSTRLVQTSQPKTLPPSLSPPLPPQAMPSKACQQFMMRNFDEVCKLFFKNRTSRSMLIQQTLMTLLPRIAALNQDLFALK